MNKLTYLIIFAVLLFSACSKDESTDAVTVDGTPIVKAESSYTVLKEEDITYAEGLSHNATSTAPFSIPLLI